MPTTITLTERRDSEPLTAEAWSTVNSDDEFWSLVERRIIQVRQGRSGVVLRPTAYVGRALAGDVELRVDSKIEGALEALIGYASRGTFRLEDIHVFATEPGELTRLLIEVFLEVAGRYLQFGMDFRYREQREAGPFLRGRMNLPATLLMHAKGRSLEVSYVRRERSVSTPLNLLMAAALLHVERLAEQLGQATTLRARARNYLLAFPLELLEAARDTADVPEADELDIDQPLVRDAAELATAVLAAAGFEAAAPLVDRTVPRSWFLNLETLFEQAMRTTLRRAPGVVGVRNGKHENRYVFPDDPVKTLDASPDLLVKLAGGLIVGDVKYKDWSGAAAAADLYQLLVHAGTFQASRAFLVYPGVQYEAVDLGVSTLGIATRLFCVRPQRLAADAARLADALRGWRAPRSSRIAV